MKKILLFNLLLLCFSNILFSKELTIYTYSSFNSEWGPGPKVFPIFEKKCDCKLKVIGLEDTGQLLARFLLEQKKPKADILLGLNDTHLAKLSNLELFASYNGKHYHLLDIKFMLDKEKKFIPFDYGNLAFIYDSQKITNPPKSLDDLLDSRFKKKIVIESAVTSAPGLSFLHWTIQHYGEKNFREYWQKLAPNLITVSNNWSTAYGMFIKGETAIVLSYSTSPAYHLINENTDRYKAAIFKQGHYPQIEFATIVKQSDNIKLAQKFIDFLLEEEFQTAIPTTNWMYPVIEYKQLPTAFENVKKIKTLPLLNKNLINIKNKEWQKHWSIALRKRK